jgi:signal transduction histidine kinase
MKSAHLLPRFLLGLLAVLALSLAAFILSMNPPISDLGAMALFLSFTAGVSGVFGAIAHRQGWLERMPSLRIALFGGYALAGLLTFFNVWVTARLMFASEHDLQLATVLLIFATSIAILLGYFLSSAVTGRIRALSAASRRLAEGDLATRAQVEGRDEVAALGEAFNEMAERLQDAQRRQQEIESLRRDLVAWAGHDLQTPLAAIRVQLEALADGMVEDPDDVQRYLRAAQRQVGDLSRLIDDLFQVAQLDAGGLVIQAMECSLSDLISDTLESFSALAAQQGVTLSGSADLQVDPAIIDAPRLGRVLNNLIGNALRHTPPAGMVTVTAHRAGERILIEVADNGEGIHPDDLPHIFERFYRGDKSRTGGAGAGLGLAIAAGIVRAHHGEIHAESRLGEGARFRISLPA